MELVRPWRTATLVATGIAALEFVALLVAGVLLFGRPLVRSFDSTPAAAASVPKHRSAQRAAQAAPAAPALSRGETSVIVLNGNGRAGAAQEAAARVQGLGYLLGTVGNAPRSDYATSMVMYRSGYAAEGRRLARDLGLRVVGPLDGMRPGQLMGSQIAVVLGS